MKPGRKWRASERIALRVLEEKGYRIVETRKRLVIDGIEIAEIDAIAVDEEGNRYAVEIKAGRLDVTGVRQAYSNAVLVGAKPLVVCRGFADEAARITAEKLGVQVLELSDVFLVDADELEDLIYTAVADSLSEALASLLDPRRRIPPEQLQTLEQLARSSSLQDFAEKLGKTVREAAQVIAVLKKQGILPRRGNYNVLRAYAKLVYTRAQLQLLLEKLDRIAETIEKCSKGVGGSPGA